jgi:hypothetical protein
MRALAISVAIIIILCGPIASALGVIMLHEVSGWW